ncbi:MAG: rane fusion protein multidrug efflux system [Bryobacterales bacterium]|jgi:membrane fusion protein (multidrug efflux system)|nr:rane fusion protein multidrug efflux system [Bryobacterales bacterium]
MGPVGWVVLLVILVAAGIGGARLWTYLQSYEETDDAQVDGDIYAVTSRIAGTIKAVHVEDNQQVKVGQLLVELDPADYHVALEQARAAVQEARTQVAAVRPNVSITTLSTETAVSSYQAETIGARAQVAAAQRDYESVVAQVRQAEADLAKAQADLARYKQLIAKDEISQQQYDQAESAARSLSALTDARRASADAAARNIEAAQARLQQSEVRASEATRNRPQMIQLQNAQVQSRQASTAVQQSMLNQAALNLSYVNIVAAVDGIIGRKNAEPGQHVTAGQQLMADVAIGNLWVTANFKETQLKKVTPNQRVTFHVDAYGQDLEGYVENIAGASGARFSLLPPENATGNYVKVVQRIPVRIRIKEGQDPQHRLRPGMSVVPKIWVQ